MMEKDRIIGEKIILRPMTTEDTDLIVKWRNTDFVRKNFIYQKPFTREGHLFWIKNMVDTGKVVQYMICTKEELPVGSVYLRDIDREHKKAEYGIFIGEEEALSKGYGSEAARLMIRYAFGKLKLHKLMLRVLAENERAKKSYKNAGFLQEGYFHDDVCLEDGYHDVIFMAVINEEVQ